MFSRAGEKLMEAEDMEIKTKRLVLKPLGIKYLDSCFEYASDIETTKYMLHLPIENMEDEIEFLKEVDAEWIKEKPGFYEFAVLLNNKHIGAVCINLDKTHIKGEIGWIMNKNYWNHGFTTEAAEAVLDFAVNTLHLKHIVAHCDSENIGSYRVMENIGMKKTAVSGGRKNKSSDEERIEYEYEIAIE